MATAILGVQVGEPTLDWNRLYHAFNELPVQPTGFNKAGDPFGPGGKVMAQRESVKYFLQDGMVFDEAGKLVPGKSVPKTVRAQIDRMKQTNPFPGITHPGRVQKCPVPGCEFSTTVEVYYRDHKRLHRDVTAEQWAQWEGQVRGISTPYSLSDFADPAEGMNRLTDAAGPQRESPQGEG